MDPATPIGCAPVPGAAVGSTAIHWFVCSTRQARSRAVAALIVAAALAAPARAQQFYRIESAVAMKSAAPSWDYLTFEPKRSYLYIARRGDGVTVYDAAAKKLIGTLANSAHANATTLVSELDRGYTTNEDGSTTVFQLSTLKMLKRIKIAEEADSAAYEPVSKQLAFTDGDAKQIIFSIPKQMPSWASSS